MLTDENVPTVAAICARLDGLPLALELISARIKLLSPAALLERLHGRLMLQSDGLHDLEPRHRTLNAAIDWSYQLLSLEEQTLFRRLSIFVGGWTLESAEAVCLQDLTLNILDGLAALLDKNLVKQDTRSDGERRCMILETIREYALEQLAASDEADDLLKLHADYFVKLAEAAEAHASSREHSTWFDRLEVESDNLRAALAKGETGLRLVVALREYWLRRGHLIEGISWLADALTRFAVVSTAEDRLMRARALEWLGLFYMYQGDWETPLIHCEESLVLFRELEDSKGITDLLGTLGMLYEMLGDYERAGVRLDERLTLHRKLENTNGIAWGLYFLGTLAYIQNHISRAGDLLGESLAGMRATSDTLGIPIVLNLLAMVVLDRGDYARAGAYLGESLSLLRELGERLNIVHTLEILAHLMTIKPSGRRMGSRVSLG